MPARRQPPGRAGAGRPGRPPRRLRLPLSSPGRAGRAGRSVAGVPNAVDYDLAVATARRLAPAPPAVSWAEAGDAVAELRRLAVTAEEHVRAVTGLTPPGDVLEATVVDRPGLVAGQRRGLPRRARAAHPHASRRSGRTPLAAAVTAKVAGRADGLDAGLAVEQGARAVRGVPPRGRARPADARRAEHRRDRAPARRRPARLPAVGDAARGHPPHAVHRRPVDARPRALGDRGAARGHLARRPGRSCSSGSRASSPSCRAAGRSSSCCRRPEQKVVLDRVTAFMSLLEGHAEHVMDGVGPSVVPSVRHIRAQVRPAPQGAPRACSTGSCARCSASTSRRCSTPRASASSTPPSASSAWPASTACGSRPRRCRPAQEIREPLLWVARLSGPPGHPGLSRCHAQWRVTGPPAATAAVRVAVRRVARRRRRPGRRGRQRRRRLARPGGGARLRAARVVRPRRRPRPAAGVGAGRRARRRAVPRRSAWLRTCSTVARRVHSTRVLCDAGERGRAGGGARAPPATPRSTAPPTSAALAAVLLGHTLDDQAETVLLGLARGSGARALAGMAPVRGRYRRPLLGVDRARRPAPPAPRRACVPWDDPHNAAPAYARVRVRTAVLPVLEDAARARGRRGAGPHARAAARGRRRARRAHPRHRRRRRAARPARGAARRARSSAGRSARAAARSPPRTSTRCGRSSRTGTGRGRWRCREGCAPGATGARLASGP